MTLKSLKPAVSKTWLIVLAGLMWSVVGLMLCRLAYHWLAVIQGGWIAPLELLGDPPRPDGPPILLFEDCPEEHCETFPANGENLHLRLSKVEELLS